MISRNYTQKMPGLAAILMVSAALSGPAFAEDSGSAPNTPQIEMAIAATVAHDRAGPTETPQNAPHNLVANVVAPMPAVLVSGALPGPTVRPSRMMNDSELYAQRGGAALVVTSQTLTAITQGNVLNGGFLAGNVNLSDNALSNFNGVGNILINTGAQVSLQTGMNITINIGA